MQCAFAFDAGQCADGQGADFGTHPSFRSALNGVTLNVENTRSTSPPDMPSRRKSGNQCRGIGRCRRTEASVAAAVKRRAERSAAGVCHRSQAGDSVGHDNTGHSTVLAFGAHGLGGQSRLTPDQQRGKGVEQLAAVDRTALQLVVDLDVCGRGSRGRERVDVFGLGVDDRGELLDIGEIA